MRKLFILSDINWEILFILLLQWAKKSCTNMSWPYSGKCLHTVFHVSVVKLQYDRITRISMMFSKNSGLIWELIYETRSSSRSVFCAWKMFWYLCQPSRQTTESISVHWLHCAMWIEFWHSHRSLPHSCFIWYEPGINLGFHGGPVFCFCECSCSVHWASSGNCSS